MAYSIIPIFLPHLGCPNECVFCNQRAIAAPAPPPAEEVRKIVSIALEYAKNPQIAYYGGSFTALGIAEQQRYLAAAFDFVKSGAVRSVRVSTRPDYMDERTAERLFSYGVRTVELGAQSMDDGVLLSSKRGHTAQDTAHAASIIKGSGIELILQMMTGLPGSNAEKDIQTALALAALRPDGVRIYPTCVIAGSELEQMHLNNEYEPQSIEQATELCAHLLGIFERVQIPVLRIGLNPTDELTHGGVLAGPYHPSMGELARSRRLRSLACEALDKLPSGRAVLTVPRGRAPLLRGQKRCNIHYFEQEYPHLRVEIRENAEQTAQICAHSER